MTLSQRFSISSQHWNTLLKLGIIVVTLGAAYVLGPRAGSRMTLVVPALVGVILFLRVPEVGLLTVIIGAVAIPFTLGTGTQSSLHVAMLLIPGLMALWWGEMLLRQRFSLHPSPVYGPLLLYVVSATLSLVAGGVLWNAFYGFAPIAAQFGGWAIMVFSGLLLLLAAERIGSVRWLQVLVIVFCVPATLAFLGRTYPRLGTVVDEFVLPGAQGSMLWIWLVALPGGQALLNNRLPKIVRLLLGGLAVAVVARAYLGEVDWASGWAPIMVVLAALLWTRSWRFGLVVTLMAAVVLSLAGTNVVSTLIKGDAYSVETRSAAWQVLANNVLPTNPILGLGPANYYYDTIIYPILGYNIRFNSHNQYIDILAQTGIVGMISVAWLVAAIAGVGYRVLRRTQGFSRGYAGACLAGLAGILAAGMLGDWFIPFVYNIGMNGTRASLMGWLFLGGLVALDRLTRNEQTQA